MLALYFFSGPLASVYGCYHVALESARHETGLSDEALRAALVFLEQLEFCRYDSDTEFVWVCEMVAHQFDLPLLAHDYQCKNAQRWYAELPKNPWLGPFWDRYVAGLHLGPKREYVKPVGLSKAPSEPLPSPSKAPPKGQVRNRSDQDQVLVLTKVQYEETEFEAFWKHYPRKDSKKTAWAAWRKLHPSPDLQVEMLEAVRRQRMTEQWTHDGGRGIPYLATWLNGERWRDQGPQVPKGSAQTLGTLHAVAEFLGSK